MMIQKRADQIVVGDVLVASDHNSTGLVRVATIKHGMVYINAGHFDREVPAHTMLDVYTDNHPDLSGPNALPSAVLVWSLRTRRHTR